jgi:ATP-GRASP peptide maturase of grasp-with-spasm system
MVLIISQSSDRSTDNVMDWLSYMGISCRRVNGEKIFNYEYNTSFELGFSSNASHLTLTDDTTINLKDVKSIWHRRDALNSFAPLQEKSDEPFPPEMLKHLRSENIEAKQAFYYCIEDEKKILGNFERSSFNKISMLTAAKKQGIDIPVTLVTNRKSNLLEFMSAHPRLITKAIQEGYDFSLQREGRHEFYLSYTEELDQELIQSIPETFFPSLFQEKLDKELDIRVFFLDGTCYSMAIFSQLDNQTNVDFRKYNKKVNNRNVPYKLPELLEEKIALLMSDLRLNTGSIDIIKTKNGRFVFLEVNPVGQYGMTSIPCNYHLDKKIAEYLAY